MCRRFGQGKKYTVADLVFYNIFCHRFSMSLILSVADLTIPHLDPLPLDFMFSFRHIMFCGLGGMCNSYDRGNICIMSLATIFIVPTPRHPIF